MDETGHRALSAVVDAGHCPGEGSGRRDTSEERSHYVCYTLSYEFCICIMLLSCRTVSDHGCQKRLYGAKDGDGERRRNKSLDGLVVELRSHRLRHRKSVRKLWELRADGCELYSGKLAQKD